MNNSVFENMLQNLGLIDSGCPEPCVGQPWIKQYEESCGKTLDTLEKVEHFKFGDTVYKARYYKKIPIKLGSTVKEVMAGVVDAQVPLLISNEDLKSWKTSIDFENKTLILKKTNEMVQLIKTKSGHLAVALEKNIDVDEEKLVHDIKHVEINKMTFKDVKKLHHVYEHTT